MLSVFLLSIYGCNQKAITGSGWEKLACGLVFPEGPALASDGDIYFSNCNGGWIGVYADGVLDTFLIAGKNTFIKTNGLGWHENFLYACEYGRGKIIKIDTAGKVTNLVTEYNGEKFNRPNDLTFDKFGNLYFTDPGTYDPENPDGRLFRVNLTTREVTLMQENISFPNGIGFSPADQKLYVCESAKNRILRFDVSGEKLINREVFVELSGGDPDGFNFDEKGNMAVAHFGSGTLFIISSKGKIIGKIPTPGKKPTNVEIDGNIIYLTETETNGLYRTEIQKK